MGDLGLGGEGTHGDVAQMIRVAHDHMYQEVVVACHVIKGHDFEQLLGVFPEASHLSGFVTVQANGNHRLEAHPDYRWVNIGVEPAENTCMLEPAYPLRASGLGNTHSTCDFLVGQTRIVLEKRHDGAICSVEQPFCHHDPNTFQVLLTIAAGFIISNPNV